MYARIHVQSNALEGIHVGFVSPWARPYTIKGNLGDKVYLVNQDHKVSKIHGGLLKSATISPPLQKITPGTESNLPTPAADTPTSGASKEPNPTAQSTVTPDMPNPTACSDQLRTSSLERSVEHNLTIRAEPSSGKSKEPNPTAQPTVPPERQNPTACSDQLTRKPSLVSTSRTDQEVVPIPAVNASTRPTTRRTPGPVSDLTPKSAAKGPTMVSNQTIEQHRVMPYN